MRKEFVEQLEVLKCQLMNQISIKTVNDVPLNGE